MFSSFASTSSGGPNINRRRGTRSVGSNLVLNSTALIVLGGIVLTVFAIGVLLGSHSISQISIEDEITTFRKEQESKKDINESEVLSPSSTFVSSLNHSNLSVDRDDDEFDGVNERNKNLRGGVAKTEKKKKDVVVEEEEEDDAELQQRLEEHKQRLSQPEAMVTDGEDQKTEKSSAFSKSKIPSFSSFPHFGNSNLDTANYEPKGGKRFEEWKDGETPYRITPTDMKVSDDLARERREHIRNAMKHAWNGYKTHAFGHDEVLPITGKTNDNWGGLGTTLVDALDTLWLMDMKKEFWEARDWVRDSLTHERDQLVSVFETNIRSLGGLLGAYDLSGDTAFLHKALDLGNRLVKAFDSPNGIPYGLVNLVTGEAQNAAWSGINAPLAELGTLQMEFRYLSDVSGDKKFAEKSERVFEQLKSIEPENGLYPIFVNNARKTLSFGNKQVGFGAMADSFYEYELKIWLQGGKKEHMYLEMYKRSVDGLHNELLQKSTPSGLWYVADKIGHTLDHKMDHLVCFTGGLLALGAYTNPEGLDSPRAQRDLKTAKALTYTCYQMYARMPTGIAPESVRFQNGRDFVQGHSSHYILRPETVESFFILNKLTGDPIYREMGWEVFQSIEKYCRTDIAYGPLHNVNVKDGVPENRMESFFMAETLKYLYLLFDPDTEIDILGKHVFNTEAHPLKNFNYT